MSEHQNTIKQPSTGPHHCARIQITGRVYVGEQGIAVKHTQVTVRTRSRPSAPQRSASDSTRLVSVTCLICKIIAYRVLQDVPIDVAAVEGPLLPTDDWVEQDVLKSSTGWVEVCRSCLNGEDIRDLERSSAYSSIYAVVLPRDALTPGSPVPSYEQLLAPLPTPSVEVKHLPHLPPLLPPPPFTPAHPVFAHFAELAAARSEALRSEAEEELAEVVRRKVDQVLEMEADLKRQVEMLWRAFRRNASDMQQQRPEKSLFRRRTDSGVSPWPRTPDATVPDAAPVSIRDFNPTPAPAKHALSSSNAPRKSALSATLSTSTFHHPAYKEEKSSSGSTPLLESPLPMDGNGRPAWPGLSRSVPIGVKRPEEDTPVLRDVLRRNMDQKVDMATSFKYVSTSRVNREQRRGRAEAEEQQSSGILENNTISHRVNSPDEPRERGRTRTRSRSKTRATSADRSKDVKGKRKVTFDVKPTVVTITREVEAEQRAEEVANAEKNAGDMIFELDESGAAKDDKESIGLVDTASSLSEVDKDALPLVDSPRAHRKRKLLRRSQSDALGLPQSLSALRPSSLPAPASLDRLRAGPLYSENRSASASSIDVSPKEQATGTTISRDDSIESPLDPREAEIRRLVAADIPSHRSAWKRDGLAWQTFVRRRGGAARYPDASMIAEVDEQEDTDVSLQDEDETEEDTSLDEQDGEEWNVHRDEGLSKSLPIAIGPVGRQAASYDYQAKTSLSDHPGVLVPALRSKGLASSAALRKASYAERDRLRETDPGALDFAAEDDDDYEDDSSTVVGTYVGERSRQRALRILEARSKIPDSGMWRSLAS